MTEALERLAALARALSTAETLDEVAATTAREACGAAKAVAAAVYVLSHDGRSLVLAGVHGVAPEARARAADGDDALARAVRSGQAEWRASGSRLAPEATATAAVPCVVERRVIGVAEIALRAEPTAEPDRALVEMIVALAAQALERARGAAVGEQAHAIATRLDVSLDAADAMARATQPSDVLTELAQVCVPRLADWCTIDLVDDGAITLAVAMHVDEREVARAKELRQRYPVDPNAPRGVANVLRTGVPELYASISDELLPERARDEGERRILLELKVRSAVIVPLKTHERVLGAMTLVSTRDELRYDATDVRVAEKLASRAALALANARLIAELRARADAEGEAREAAQRAASRLAILADASRAFADAALDPRLVTAALASIVTRRLDHGCVVMCVGEGGLLEPTNIAHVDPARAELLRDVIGTQPLRADETPGATVIASGAPFVAASPDRAALAARLARYAETFPVASVAVVPVRVHRELAATITAIRDAGPPHDDDDVWLLQDLADRAGAALGNAAVHAAEQDARQLAERQQTFASRLTEALATDEMLDVILDGVRAELRSDAAAFLEAAAEGAFRLRRQRGLGDAARQLLREIPPTPPGAFAAAVRERRPVFVESFEEGRRRFPGARLVDEHVHPGAFACVPLVFGNGVVQGAVVLVDDEPRRYSAADRAFAAGVADACAQALERARLLAAERSATADVEAASRLKDEFLATVSHELRTPLNAILGWASLLRSGRLEETATARALATIERNARAQARLVDDVLDVSRIISGKLAIKSDAVDVTAVLAQALDVVRPGALAKEIAIEVHCAPALPRVLGDADRLQQVLWNVLSNAVKFTPRRGRVTVRAFADFDRVLVEVADSGEGIHADFLPHLFEPFRQADGTTTRRHGGLGLGLSIARHLVQLHGGDIAAASPGEGHGAVFTIRLPAAAEEPLRATAATGRYRRVATRLEQLDIVCVDDDLDARELASTILEGEGAVVRLAATGRQALELVDARPPDVLVCDIAMPDIDGVALLPRARALAAAQGKHFGALAFTAYADAEHAGLVAKAGFDGHLTKPVDAEALVVAIAQVAYER